MTSFPDFMSSMLDKRGHHRLISRIVLQGFDAYKVESDDEARMGSVHASS